MALHQTPPQCPVRYPFGTHHTLDLEPDYRDCGSVTAVVLPSGRTGWLVTDHHLARQVLADPRFSREAANQPHTARLSTELLPSAAILANDPPRHTRLRSLVSAMFAPPRIAEMAPAVTALAQDLVQTLLAGPAPADILAGFIEPFAGAVVCEIFGVPGAFRSRVFTLGDALTARDATAETLAAARSDCELLAREMATHSDSGLFALLGRTPSLDEEVINLIIACLIGGRGSPTVFLSSALFALLRDRNQYQRLVTDPGSIPMAVEELLRFVPVGVGGGFTRVAREQVQLGPVLIAAGESVIPAMHAAGRDPVVFDRAEELVLDRGPKIAHLAFGHGAHYCVGAGLARLEAQIVLRTLVSQIPDLRLAEADDQGSWRQGRVVRSLDRLDVTWTHA